MRLLLIPITLVLSACATTQQDTKSNIVVNSIEFTNSVTAIPQSMVNKKECVTNSIKLNSMAWKKLIELANSCVAAEKWGQVDEIARVLSAQTVHAPWGAYYHSLASEKLSSYDRAIWMIELSIKKAPKVGLFHYQKGRVLWKKNEYSESVKSFAQAVQLDPNLIDAHLFLGQAYFRDQDYAKAAQYFQAVLKVRPKDPTAIMGLAECNIQSSDAKGALELLEKGDRNYPGEPAFIIRQAFVYEFLLNDIVKAIEIYNKIQEGYTTGKYNRALDFSVSQKIRDLEMSVKSNRSIAGANAGVKQ